MLIPRKHYTSCEDLPLYNWIKLITSDDLKYLWIERKKAWHKEVDLKPIWESIFEEYTALTNDKSSNHVLSMVRNITVINNKLEIIQACVNLLSIANDLDAMAPTIQILKDFGFRFKYTPETLYEDLKRTVSSAKTLIIQRAQLEKEYQTFSDKNEKATEKDYYNMVTQLSRFIHSEIDIRKTTVMSYISYVEQYNNSLKDGK